MIFHMVALSLPVEGFYFPLHKHESAELCRWTPQDRDSYENALRQIEEIYSSGPSPALTNREDLEALYDPSLSPQDAVRKVLPYYISCYSANKKRLNFPHVQRNSVEVVGPAGTQDEDGGIRLTVIGKGCSKLQLLPWVIERAGELRGSPFSEEEIHTLDGRSDRSLVEVVSRSSLPLCSEGSAKIVAVPREANVRLSRTHRGEFVSEIPRVWA